MLKMYHKQDHAGDTPDFWEDNWESSEFERSVSFCSVDPLRPLFERYLRPGSMMLEGGCGIGNYVTYYTARGYRVVGLDFAQRALKTLRGRQPSVSLCGGDVSCLPFADNIFDIYYSGGVVEHFEGGAMDSLREARRVLKDDGVLLISVPYYSPLRRLLSPFRTSEWRRVKESVVGETEMPLDKKFFQYAYRTNEFVRMLADAGLGTIEKQGYAVLWGLYELPLINRNGGEFSGKTVADPQPETAETDTGKLIGDRPNSLLKRLVVSEDASVPVLGLGVKIMRWAAGNMMMYVCKRSL
jgi:ubiquinone/menaquinone biosynthesis C-methylase UbiE